VRALNQPEDEGCPLERTQAAKLWQMCHVAGAARFAEAAIASGN
jgi:hypothetical protein